jgi:hypothetical protein
VRYVGGKFYTRKAMLQFLVERMSQIHTVFVSELTMPDDRFIDVWSKQHRGILNKSLSKIRLEKVFVARSSIAHDLVLQKGNRNGQ